jgi:hypothetical protein
VADQQVASTAGVGHMTHLGRTGYHAIHGKALEGDGAIYVAGNSESANFPTLNPYDPNYSSGTFGDVLPTKFVADGQGLVCSTFVGWSAPSILDRLIPAGPAVGRGRSACGHSVRFLTNLDSSPL